MSETELSDKAHKWGYRIVRAAYLAIYAFSIAWAFYMTIAVMYMLIEIKQFGLVNIIIDISLFLTFAWLFRGLFEMRRPPYQKVRV